MKKHEYNTDIESKSFENKSEVIEEQEDNTRD